MKEKSFERLTEFCICKGNKQEITKDVFGSTIKDSVPKVFTETDSHNEFENNVEELMQN